MEPGAGVGGGGGGANSSDFVRKLYKMLEDPKHGDIVRWSARGDSFIVVDTNRFTAEILPQHFKHGNFASFVRQLNKYDFHKIKNTEEGANNQCNEFRHNDFTKDSKDNLDNIRRKAPASRKSQQQLDDAGSAQFIELQQRMESMRKESEEMKKQTSKVSEQYIIAMGDLGHMHDSLGNHATLIHKHDNTIQMLLGMIEALAAECERLRRGQHGDGIENGQEGLSPTGVDATGASPGSTRLGRPNFLKIHDQVKQLRRLYTESQQPGAAFDPNPAETGANSNFVDKGGTHNDHDMGALNGLQGSGPSQQTLVQHGGGEAYGNGPYSMGQNVNGNGLGMLSRPMPTRKRSSASTPNWKTQPRVLLVEDDPTCRRIGSKFLTNADCSVDIADDGLVAVQKLHVCEYDLVLMDIMMPNLDGCSATHLIRKFNGYTPIVAMTSNIRNTDLAMYFESGMNDILPKPFTKDGLFSLLVRMLPHMCINPPPIQQQPGTPHDPPRSTPTNVMIPVATNSPANGELYGAGSSPADMGGDREMGPPQSQSAVTMNDGGYMHGMMGGYVDGDPSQHTQMGAYAAGPASGQRRRRDEATMIGPHGPEDMYPEMKKQRY